MIWWNEGKQVNGTVFFLAVVYCIWRLYYVSTYKCIYKFVSGKI